MRGKKLALLILFLCLFFPFFSQLADAGTIDSQESVSVTAKVPDEIPPSTPVLIAPENGAYLDSQQVTFEFKKSNDQQSFVRHYQLYINDQLKVPEIPATQTPVENEQFICLISNERIKLTLKKPLSDGVYTWKIRAWDNYGNHLDSAVWTFTIDTIGPFIILNQVGEENTQLGFSTKDPNSIPANTKLITYNLKPKFVGKSEPNANLRISLTNKTGKTRKITGRVDNQGNYQLLPGHKLSSGEYTVQIVASDAAGNTNVLPQFQLQIKKPEFLTQIPLITAPEVFYQLPVAPFRKFCISEQTITMLILFIPLLLWFICSKIGYGFPFYTSLSFITYYSFLLKKVRGLLNKHPYKLFANFNGKPLPFTKVYIFKKQANNVLTKKLRLGNKKGTLKFKNIPDTDFLLLSRPGFHTTKLKKLKQENTEVWLIRDKKLAFYKTFIFLGKIFLLLSLIASLAMMINSPNFVYFLLFFISLDLIIGLLI